MDPSNVEHSDSDSGESWTILENSPSYADDAPEFIDQTAQERDAAGRPNDKDEDTDGISIISDSEPDSSTPCDLSFERYPSEDSHLAEHHIPEYISVPPIPPNFHDHQKSIRSEDDFLGDSSIKHKTYVHRRNKRLSTVLNVIMLGSVITAAGVAIGHMWGARNDCTIQTTPSVNKILSNLYKLQEENIYLRNKLKEFTLVNNVHMQRKQPSDKVPVKQHRCKKMYEESLNNKNVEKATKCVEHDNNAASLLQKPIVLPQYEKDFLNDIDKLKNVYQQNKSWLDDEIAKRLKHEEKIVKKLKQNLKTNNLITVHEEPADSAEEISKEITQQDMSKEPKTDSILYLDTVGSVNNVPLDVLKNNEINEFLSKNKISYADSLKSEQSPKIIQKRDINNLPEEEPKRRMKKKDIESKAEVTSSDYEFKKDDRYSAPKLKQERKKHDRQKLHKKQKRRNKYEQWEMKGGYLKDFDEYSITSSQENENVINKPDKNFTSREFERHNYISQFGETENSKKPLTGANKINIGKEKNDVNWYEVRVALRTEARKKLEKELFGETSPNNAGWYFRRMHKREQCRAKGDNSTFRKFSKRNMNYKMKH